MPERSLWSQGEGAEGKPDGRQRDAPQAGDVPSTMELAVDPVQIKQCVMDCALCGVLASSGRETLAVCNALIVSWTVHCVEYRPPVARKHWRYAMLS